VATGGSPIVTWLPNQLMAVLEAMEEVWEGAEGGLGERVKEVMEGAVAQKVTLMKEVEKYREERKEN